MNKIVSISLRVLEVAAAIFLVAYFCVILPQQAEHDKNEAKKPRFTIGSTKAAVIAAQGPPREIDFSEKGDVENWRYYSRGARENEDDGGAMTDSGKAYVDTVYLDVKEGTVCSYTNHTGNLRVK